MILITFTLDLVVMSDKLMATATAKKDSIILVDS